MKLNVKTVLATKAENEARVKPLPKVKIKPKVVSEIKTSVQEIGTDVPEIRISVQTDEKAVLLLQLDIEFTALMKERAMLSTKTGKLVAEIEARLRKESPAMAESFLRGEMPMPELAEHYEKIQSLIEKGAELYDRIEFVNQYGKLPDPEPLVEIDQGPAVNEKELSHDIRRLDDLIYKCQKKIDSASGGLKKPVNSERVILWKNKMALAHTKREDLKAKLKKLQYDARTKRVGTE